MNLVTTPSQAGVEILVVEDTAASLKLLSDLLTETGYSVREASNGELALWTVSVRVPDLILLDIRMPGINGLEVCRRLKSDPKTATVPVIFLSALSDADDKIEGFSVGAVDYIGKPYSAGEVVARVNTHVSLRLLARDLQESNRRLQDTLDDLHLTQDKLVQAENLAALGSIVAAVAHESNTPIGNCLTVASTLADKVASMELTIAAGELRRTQFDDCIEAMHNGLPMLLKNIERVASLIRNFRKVATPENDLIRCSFDLSQTIGDLVQRLRTSLHATSYRLEIELEPGLAMDSFPDSIVQIITHLFNNSVLHGFNGRTDGLIRLVVGVENEVVTVIYSDDGVGMSERICKHIFEPFFTTRLGLGSSGLGMSICYALITGPLGGCIEVASREGKGSSFTITMPRIAPHRTLPMPG